MTSLPLKEYQERALDTLQAYFQLSQQLGDADTAFYRLTRETFGRGVPYQPVEGLPGLPYVCLRIPTGGGKTLSRQPCHRHYGPRSAAHRSRPGALAGAFQRDPRPNLARPVRSEPSLPPGG